MNETPDSNKKRGLLSRFLPTSVAGMAALATVAALLMMLLAVWAIRIFGPQSVAHSYTMTWPRVLAEFLLVLIIPVVLYWGLRRWNQVIEGVYPDIDKAWQSGIDALRAQGISVSDLPIFLVVGSSQRELEEGLVHALETDVRIHGIPNEAGIRHALQWYTTPEAIYLFCSGSSSLSALLGRWTAPTSTTGQRRTPSVGSPNPAPTVAPANPLAVPAATRPPQPTAAKAQPAAPPSPGKKPPQAYLGTLVSDSVSAPATGAPATGAPATGAPTTGAPTTGAARPAGPSSPPPAGITPAATFAKPQQPADAKAAKPASPKPQYFGTLSTEQLSSSPTANPTPPAADSARSTEPFARPVNRPVVPAPKADIAESRVEPASRGQFGAGGERAPNSAAADARPAPPATAPRVSRGKLALPSSLDTSDQLARLRYVCTLLRRIRQPRCGINGILALLPFELSSVGPLHLSALAQSARGDVQTIQSTLGIRSPLSAMLIGLEQDKGFNELVRRLQPELLSRRLGGRFDLRSRPTPEELNGHSDLLCDAFEDWVYRLFGRDDALAQQRGNRKLYELISRIRHELKPRLRIVLGEAFGCEPQADIDRSKVDTSFFFSGCYFAASGATTGQPAFVKGVLQDKMIAEQSQVEWTPAALRAQTYFRAAAIVGWIAAGILAALAVMQWMAN